jgi:hypothetical protein
MRKAMFLTYYCLACCVSRDLHSNERNSEGNEALTLISEKTLRDIQGKGSKKEAKKLNGWMKQSTPRQERKDLRIFMIISFRVSFQFVILQWIVDLGLLLFPPLLETLLLSCLSSWILSLVLCLELPFIQMRFNLFCCIWMIVSYTFLSCLVFIHSDSLVCVSPSTLWIKMKWNGSSGSNRRIRWWWSLLPVERFVSLEWRWRRKNKSERDSNAWKENKREKSNRRPSSSFFLVFHIRLRLSPFEREEDWTRKTKIVKSAWREVQYDQEMMSQPFAFTFWDLTPEWLSTWSSQLLFHKSYLSTKPYLDFLSYAALCETCPKSSSIWLNLIPFSMTSFSHSLCLPKFSLPPFCMMTSSTWLPLTMNSLHWFYSWRHNRLLIIFS